MSIWRIIYSILTFITVILGIESIIKLKKNKEKLIDEEGKVNEEVRRSFEIRLKILIILSIIRINFYYGKYCIKKFIIQKMF